MAKFGPYYVPLLYAIYVVTDLRSMLSVNRQSTRGNPLLLMSHPAWERYISLHSPLLSVEIIAGQILWILRLRRLDMQTLILSLLQTILRSGQTFDSSLPRAHLRVSGVIRFHRTENNISVNRMYKTYS